MPNKFVFADEAGDFAFKRQPGASKYFILCTLTTEDCKLSHDLLHVRRELTLSGDAERDKLHATEDPQAVRDLVFPILAKHDFRIDATILEKSKAQPKTRTTDAAFYHYAWYFHFKHVGPLVAARADKVLITAASIGTKKTKATFKESLNNSVQQVLPRSKWEASFIESAKDPLLWAVDYCAWAIQRKWEKDDMRSYYLIGEKIKTEYDLWRIGHKHYY